MIDHASVHKVFLAEIDRAGSQTEFARRCGVSIAYVNDIATGKKRVSKRMARAIGYERRLVYLKRNKGG